MANTRSMDGGVSWMNTKNGGLVNLLTQFIVGTPLLGPDVMAIGLQDNGSRVRQGNTSIFNQVNPLCPTLQCLQTIS